MIFGLSMGCCYKFSSRNDTIDLYRKEFSKYINAVEIIIAPKEIKGFKLSDENIKWLNSLDYLSIHLLDKHKDNVRLMDKIMYDLKYDRLIVHVNKTYKEYKYNSFVLIENIENQKYGYEDFFNMCFDISHALKFGGSYIDNFFDEKMFDIQQVHLSNTINQECHKLFYKDKGYGSVFFDYFKKPLLSLVNRNVPIILEGVAESKEELKKEVLYIRRELNGKN